MGQNCSTNNQRTLPPPSAVTADRPIAEDTASVASKAAAKERPEPCPTRAATASSGASSDGDPASPIEAAPSPTPSLSLSSRSSPRRHRLKLFEVYDVLPRTEGRGGDGYVRKCVHRRTGMIRAVKTVSIISPRKRNLIRREVSFLEEVDHPNVVSLRGWFEDRDGMHIVTDLCAGGELFHRIVEKKALHRASRGGGRISTTPCFSERDAARIIDSLLLAVSHLHSLDIVHRDIKPENILFLEKFSDASPIKLIDFGLAARHPPGTEPLTRRAGTPGYMAPEVLAGNYDRACDLWSVGVVAHVMLSGRQAFPGRTNDEIFANVQKGFDPRSLEGEAWSGISDCAKDFVRCLLENDPTERSTAEGALRHPWLEMARHAPRRRPSWPRR